MKFGYDAKLTVAEFLSSDLSKAQRLFVHVSLSPNSGQTAISKRHWKLS